MQTIVNNVFLVSVYCDAPGSVENGKALLVGDLGLYDYRNQLQRFMHNQKVIFECDEGFTLIDGPQEKICRNGLWFPAVSEPKCVFSDTPGFRWMQANRVKRRAIKSGGTGSLARSKVSGGGGGGSGGNKRRGKKGGNMGEEEEGGETDELEMCPSLAEEPYIEIEVIRPGSDPNNTDVSEGAALKVSCTHGFGVNLQNDTIVCDKGRWRPKFPLCAALPCKVPYISHGTFYLGGKALFFLEMKVHTSNIELRCSRGYVLKGPNRFHCWYGEWDVNDAPECIPASCELPQLDRGSYGSRYRAAMVVGHGTEVDYHCDGEFQKMAPGGPAKCHLGDWRPNKPACFHPSYIHGMINFTHDKDNRLITSIKRACGIPQKEKGAIFYVEGKPIDYDSDYIFPDGTEVMYRCAAAKPKPRNRWKMVCEDGQWIGGTQNLTCEMNATIAANITSAKDVIRMINSTCTYRKKETHVVTFYNDLQLTMDSQEFPPGSVLINRCIDIGKFVLRGAVRRKCISGQWLGITPKCEGLSQYYDYVVDKPPTILFRYLNGSIVQTNDGKLMVYPGTTLHMECLYIRKFGRPHWNVSNSQPQPNNPRVYPEGWTDGIENRDPTLEYRLTIEEAVEDDSGSFNCITPSRHGHEIDIIVKKVDCSPLPDRPDLLYSTDSTMLGTKVSFQCKDPNSLIGAKEIVCQSTGSWSAPLPKCENVECPDISMVPAMAPLDYTSVTRNGTLKRNETAPPKITILSREVGGKVTFSCAQGYMVEGVSDAVCQSSGDWSSAIPLCKEVECSPPPSPQNGYVTGNAPYKAGDLAQFECRQGYMMEGQPIIACQDNGMWSRASSTTKCNNSLLFNAHFTKRVKACTYPGTTIGGTISAVKFYYPIGETVEFDCTEGYDLQGSRMLHCLDTAKWSTSIPNCVSRDGNNG
ncbi:Locomotion-related protein Hikaru genki [Orchesella cincta]|uniref:Locomotion-related protein Hikaru genki n=1 Tax=Orchesella cincta TaxID=48709 RepID=A0A1D2N9D5_ORCCI|nr:Locomotion-related protein Hikaru genki [Orchesella cincta]